MQVISVCLLGKKESKLESEEQLLNLLEEKWQLGLLFIFKLWQINSHSCISFPVVNDKKILPRCFDDIEKFIARLQHAAAAFRELEKRRRSRKTKKKDLGDGMLSMRAKPPPEREFVEIFQKFKLSFNLLAKLKEMS